MTTPGSSKLLIATEIGDGSFLHAPHSMLLTLKPTDLDFVRPSHMQVLYSVCRAETKIWKAMPNGTHNDTVAEPRYFDYIADFIQDHVLKTSTRNPSNPL